MIKEIKKIIEEKVREIGFSYDATSVWKREMITIKFNEEESQYFPTWACEFYSANQLEGTIKFNIRFSRDNVYQPDIDWNYKMHIIL